MSDEIWDARLVQRGHDRLIAAVHPTPRVQPSARIRDTNGTYFAYSCTFSPSKGYGRTFDTIILPCFSSLQVV